LSRTWSVCPSNFGLFVGLVSTPTCVTGSVSSKKRDQALEGLGWRVARLCRNPDGGGAGFGWGVTVSGWFPSAYATGEITLDDFKRMRDAVGRRAEAAEALMREMAPAPVPTRRFPSDEDFAQAEELYSRWQRRELAPERIAKQNDFFRAWIEKVVVSPARRRGRPR
jgi:hypothetical protein